MMKKIFSAALAAVLCALTLCACANPDEFTDDEKMLGKYKRNNDISVTFNYADGTAEPPTSYTNYTDAMTGLSLRMLNELAKTEKGSFAFSPAAVELQLAMTANAAAPEVRQDILLSFSGNLTLDDLNRCSSYFASRMESVAKAGLKKSEKPTAHVRLGGALLINKGIDVKSSFLQTARDYYDLGVFRYEFDGEHADKKLKNQFSSYGLDEAPDVESDAALISAASISDAWLNGYEADAEAGTFNGVDGTREARFFTASEIKLQTANAVGIIKYTAKTPLKLVLIMPNEGISTEDYLKLLTVNEYAALFDSVDFTKRVSAVIPSFSLESGSASARSAMLSHCGLASLFTGGSLSAMSFNSAAQISEAWEISPKFSLSINGVNTDSAPQNISAPEPSGDTVTFDRPFIFMLVDNETNIPVQMGVYQ